MLALVSPAKKLDFETKDEVSGATQPQFSDDTFELVSHLKKLSQGKIKSLMHLSDNLAQLNYDRYQGFEEKFTNDNAKAAVYAFRGDTYVGLDADTLGAKDLDFAQNHLGILSGLYGMLRPLDLMQPYRLEMGTKFANPRGEDLYDFWGDKIAAMCNEVVKDHKNKSVISLASNEYIKAVKPKALEGDFITCDFKEMKNGAPKTIGLFAKRARGMMARYMIQNRIETPDGLKDFNTDGYVFQPAMSNEKTYTFLRDQEK